jgi:hypothetical protein
VLSAQSCFSIEKKEVDTPKAQNNPLFVCKDKEKVGLFQALTLQKSRKGEKTDDSSNVELAK